MSGQIEDVIVPNDAPTEEKVAELAAPPQPTPPQPTPQYPPLTAESLAQALSQSLPAALQPLIPQPARVPDPWENDDFFNDRKVFLDGIKKFIAKELDGFHKEKISPNEQALNAIKELLPQLVARSAENPQYNQLDSQARELMKDVPGLSYWQAFQVAQKHAAKSGGSASVARKPSVPAHLSSPDTKQTSIPDVPDNGPIDFKDIMKSIRAKGEVI